MAKITDITIIDESTIQLNSDAKSGDIIDLNTVNKIDTKILQGFINKKTEEQYLKVIEDNKRMMEQEYAFKIKDEVHKHETGFNDVKQELNNKIRDLENKLKHFEQLKESEIQTLLVKENQKYLDEINNLKNSASLDDAKYQLKIQEQKNLYENRLNEQANKLTKEIEAKSQEISNLKRQTSSLSIKKIGEDLEIWCSTEYDKYSQNGFLTSTFEKDNTSIKNEDDIKGSKGDYIFKTYLNSKFNDDEILTSAMCEMKSEDHDSVNKKKNSDHYKKLDKDRKNKNLEYAVLISELEWEHDNDVPIKKVREYEKMYVVRPAYFITFLSILEQFGNKYSELLLAKKREDIQFESVETILDEFEKIKSSVLDGPLKKMEKEADDILKNAVQIEKCAEKIKSSVTSLYDAGIEKIRDKIEKMNIKKVVKAVDKLDNN